MDNDILKCVFGGVVLIVGIAVVSATEHGAEAFKALLSSEQSQQQTTPVRDEELDELRDARGRIAAELDTLREEAASERQRMTRLLEVDHERDRELAREAAQNRAQQDWERLRREEDSARLQREQVELARRKDDDEHARWVATDHTARVRAEDERRQAHERERIAADAPVVLIPDIVPGVTPPRYSAGERERERDYGVARGRR